MSLYIDPATFGLYGDCPDCVGGVCTMNCSSASFEPVKGTTAFDEMMRDVRQVLEKAPVQPAEFWARHPQRQKPN